MISQMYEFNEYELRSFHKVPILVFRPLPTLWAVIGGKCVCKSVRKLDRGMLVAKVGLSDIRFS